MNTKDNELYKTPTTEVLVVQSEGVICQSGLRNGYGDSNPGIDPIDLDGGFWVW